MSAAAPLPNPDDEVRRVEMTAPAQPQFVRAVRLVAASLAADLGFDVEAVEDVRVAIDELCSLYAAESAADCIEVRFELSGGALDVTGTYIGTGALMAPDRLVEEILDATTDELQLPAPGSPSFAFTRRP